MEGKVFRIAAFTASSDGGNPAGVWVGDTLPDRDTMQRIAAEVGYAETAFIAPQTGAKRDIRYFSPEIEVAFCGHATIATGSVLGAESGETIYQLSTSIGTIPIKVADSDGKVVVELESVAPEQKPAPEELLESVLALLGWLKEDLDSSIPPMLAFAGVWHLVLAVKEKQVLDAFAYDFEPLKALMAKADITTLQLIWRESTELIHSRNPFPVGGVVEDPATGAAAAALGGYLRDAGLIDVPASFTIFQGEVMGCPSYIRVTVPETGGIKVAGTSAPIHSD